MRAGARVIGVLAAGALALAAVAQEPAFERARTEPDAGRPVGFSAEMAADAPADGWAPIEGVCKLTFDVAETGRVVGSTIVAECSRPELVEPAIGLAAAWRYSPPIVRGAPRAQRGLTAEVRFRRPD